MWTTHSYKLALRPQWSSALLHPNAMMLDYLLANVSFHIPQCALLFYGESTEFIDLQLYLTEFLQCLCLVQVSGLIFLSACYKL